MIIDIAVPTYNCAPWIDAFMHSLLAQTYTTWRIVTRDDGSKDETVAKIAAWQQKLGDKISILPNPLGQNLGAVGNYNVILAACQSNFVMQGDPDDLWRANKIALTLQIMHEACNQYGVATPLIVCTDAEMVSENLELISRSFLKWTRMRSKTVSRLQSMLMESPVLGATSIVNRPLLKMALPLPAQAAAQDWWLALVACAFGKIIFVDQPTISYRRHGSNDSLTPLTANGLRAITHVAQARSRLSFLVDQTVRQTQGFYERFSAQLSNSEKDAVLIICNFRKLGPLAARLALCRHGLQFSSWLKNIALFLFL